MDVDEGSAEGDLNKSGKVRARYQWRDTDINKSVDINKCVVLGFYFSDNFGTEAYPVRASGEANGLAMRLIRAFQRQSLDETADTHIKLGSKRVKS